MGLRSNAAGKFNATMRWAAGRVLLLVLLLCALRAAAAEEEDSIDDQLQEFLVKDVKAFQQYLTQRRVSEVHFPDLCPQPSADFSAENCYKIPCLTSANCTRANESCCFNGCIFTCTPNTQPPPVIDWIDDPSLHPPVALNNNDEDLEIECSTSANRVVHSCPEGYVCQILEPGDPLRAIPNRGVCVSLKDLEADGMGLFIDEAVSPWTPGQVSSVSEQSVFLPGGCLLTTEQYSGIEEFIKGRHFTSCVCSAGTVLCSVPQQEGLVLKRRRHSGRHKKCGKRGC